MVFYRLNPQEYVFKNVFLRDEKEFFKKLSKQKIIMKNPSASVVASIGSASSFNEPENEAILSEWGKLLYKLSIYHSGFAAISGVEFFDQLSIASLPTPETVINFVANLDPILDAPDWLLSIVFEKNDSAHIEDWLFGEHNKEDEESVKTRFVDFLGFSGTWEEVVLKTVELNNFVVSISAIPPIPDKLRE